LADSNCEFSSAAREKQIARFLYFDALGPENLARRIPAELKPVCGRRSFLVDSARGSGLLTQPPARQQAPQKLGESLSTSADGNLVDGDLSVGT